MSEFRRDLLTGNWVIIAPERNLRPHQFEKRKKFKHVGSPEVCPFCPGNERKTPPEVYSLRDASTLPDSPGWKIRVVPNKFPILARGAELRWVNKGFFQSISGFGYHEVIIESTYHFKTISDMETGEIERIFFTYQERLKDLKRDERIKYVVIFKNHGEEAGASISHPHSQLVALPLVPPDVENRIQNLRKFYINKEKCALCFIIEEEVKSGERVIAENKGFVAFAPFASRFPFELLLVPKVHSSSFVSLSKDERILLAKIYRDVIRRMDFVLEHPCYNVILHIPPFYGNHEEYYHWYIQIIPQLTRVAGFEVGSGIIVNVISPEQAADFLRRAEWKK